MPRLPHRSFAAALLAFFIVDGLRAQVVPGTAPDADEPVQLSTFVVSTDRDVGYMSTNAISAMRIDTPIRNLPQSVSVFNQEIIQDSNLTSLTGIMQFDPSFNNNFAAEDGVARFSARGMTSAGITYVDGFSTLGSNAIIPIVGVERIEILKGPNAILYGAGNAGGIVNRVTKRPLFQPATTITASVGQNNTNSLLNRRFNLDTSGPLAASFIPASWGQLAYRLELDYNLVGTVKQGAPSKGYSVFPSLTWRFGKNTALTLYGWYSHNEADVQWETTVSVLNGGIDSKGWGTGTIRYGWTLPDGSFFSYDPRTIRLTSERDDDARTTDYFVHMADFTHQISETLGFRSQLKYERMDDVRLEMLPEARNEWPVNVNPATGQLAFGYTDPATGVFQLNRRPTSAFGSSLVNGGVFAIDWVVPRRVRFHDLNQVVFAWRNELAWQGRLGSTRHRVMAGNEFATVKESRFRAETRTPSTPPVAGAGAWEWVSLRDPIGGGPLNFPKDNYFTAGDELTVPRRDFVSNEPNLTDTVASSFYLNDLSSFFQERLFVNVGYRYQRNESTSGRTVSADVFSGGALYHLQGASGLSVYFNANQTFEPQFALSDDGFKLPPVEGKQFEFGLKWDTADGAYTSSLTYFQLEMTNLPRNIATLPGQTILRPVGEGRKSEGIEFAFTASPWASLRLYGGATYYLDVEDPGVFGPDLWPETQPRFNANLFLRHDFKVGQVDGLFAALNCRYTGEYTSEYSVAGGIAANRAAIWLAPAEFTVNVSLGKNFRGAKANYRVAVYVDNLTDELTYGRPRSFAPSYDPGRTWRIEIKTSY